MAKNRIVNTRFWDDSFVAELDPIEKLVFLYALTNPLTDLCGAYEITLKRIAMDTGIDREMILKIFERFAQADKMRYENGWIMIKNFAKHQRRNPSIEKGIDRSLAECPQWVRDRLATDWGETDPPYSTLPKPNLKTAKKIGPADSELETWMDAIAGVLGVKSGRDLAKADRWESVVSTAIREERDLPKFLSVIKAEQVRCSTAPQYFTPENCLKNLQIAAAPSTNGNGKEKAVKAKAIEQCSLCDEGGLRDYYKPDGTFDRRDICDHK